MAKDLVCGMNVDEKTAKYKTTYKGKTHTSARQDARRRLKQIQKSTLVARLGVQVTAAVAANAKRCA